MGHGELSTTMNWSYSTIKWGIGSSWVINKTRSFHTYNYTYNPIHQSRLIARFVLVFFFGGHTCQIHMRWVYCGIRWRLCFFCLTGSGREGIVENTANLIEYCYEVNVDKKMARSNPQKVSKPICTMLVISVTQNNITKGSVVARSSYVYVDRGKGSHFIFVRSIRPTWDATWRN